MKKTYFASLFLLSGLAFFILSGCNSDSEDPESSEPEVVDNTEYDLQGPDHPDGFSFTADQEMFFTSTDAKFDGGDFPMGDFAMSMESYESQEKTFFSSDNENIDRIEISWYDCVETQDIQVGTMAMPSEEKEDILNGVTASFAKDGDSWFVENPEMYTPEQLDELDSKAEGLDGGAEFLPTSAKVGDSWDLSESEINDEFGFNLEDLDGAVSMTLEAVKDHEGEQCAFISYTIDISGIEPDQGFDMAVNMEGEVIRSLERYINVSNEGSGTMSMAGDAEGFFMEIEGDMDINQYED